MPSPAGAAGAALVASPNLAAPSRLAGFFPEFNHLDRAVSPGRAYAVVLHSPGDSDAARSLAAPHGAQTVAVTEGLLRSVGGPATGAPSISIVVGPTDGPSSIVGWLKQEGGCDEVLMGRARDLLAFKRRQGLARINGLPDFRLPPGPATGRPHILVVDRAGDDRLFGPPCEDQAYREMLAQARQDHPGSLIILYRPDPAVGALTQGDLQLADAVVDGPFDPASLIEPFEAVYTVGGDVGWEALLLGRPVACFGAPFYAGWGLTRDAAAVPNRSGARTLEAVFAAAFLALARYVDPLSDQPCTPEIAFARMAAMRRHARRVAGDWVPLNIPPPKTPTLRAFLAGPMSTYGQASLTKSEAKLGVWASRPNRTALRMSSTRPDRVVRIEDGFIRSVGLGSGFTPAGSLVIDATGIYYDADRPNDLRWILQETDFDPDLLDLAGRLRTSIVEAGLTKYNLSSGSAALLKPPPGRKTIIVPGQVENDASVLTGGRGLGNLALLQQVRRHNSAAWIVYKEHPDVTAGHRPGRLPLQQADLYADQVVENADIVDLILAADEVHTLTSLAGFEALLRRKPVVTYGSPFYAGWGLTRDLADNVDRGRGLSLEALIAGALILYPLYLDPVSRLPCDALTFVERLSQLRTDAPAHARRAGPFTPVLRYLNAVRQMTKPAGVGAY